MEPNLEHNVGLTGGSANVVIYTQFSPKNSEFLWKALDGWNFIKSCKLHSNNLDEQYFIAALR